MKWYDYTLTTVAILLTVVILTRPETNVKTVTVPINCTSMCVAELPFGVIQFDVEELETTKLAIRYELQEIGTRIKFEVTK